ncbi:MAG: class I SAM-dependent methyltransferase [Terracidiphilus sp.]
MTDTMSEKDQEKLRQMNQERFGARSAAYRTSTVHGGGADLDRLIELLAPHEGIRALDIATGAGHVAATLAATGASVTACDLTAKMLLEAEANLSSRGLKAEYVQADALQLPFVDASFDTVTARMAPHHFVDPARFVWEVFRVLRPGGSFGLVDQIAPEQAAAAEIINAFEKLRDPSHNRQLSLEEWQMLARAAGFAIHSAELYRKQVDFDWWTSVQNVSEETRRKISGLLADGPDEAREWYKPKFRENGIIEHFSIPHSILLAGKL